MKLTILGAHGTYALPGGATSGYLVRHEGHALWVDAGTGTFANLQRHEGVLDVDAVILSHRHPDHIVDLYPFFYARMFHPERPRGLPVYAPQGVFDHLKALLSDQGSDDLGRVFDLRPVEPGETFESGPFRVDTAPMAHPVPTLGMRIQADGTALAYSADTGPTDALVGLARDAALVLSEATWDEPRTGADPIHLTGAQAGEHAARAGAGGLVLTHIWPTVDRDAVCDAAEAAFGREVEVAQEGLEVEL